MTKNEVIDIVVKNVIHPEDSILIVGSLNNTLIEVLDNQGCYHVDALVSAPDGPVLYDGVTLFPPLSHQDGTHCNPEDYDLVLFTEPTDTQAKDLISVISARCQEKGITVVNVVE